MPTRSPKRLCSRPGCNNLVPVGSGGLCDAHKQARQKDYDRRRGSASERGYDYRWHKVSRMFLRNNPLCVHCLDRGETTIATDVDHKIPHKGNYNLFWDQNNWQSLCSTCHKQKTAREDGSFGNQVKSHPPPHE